MSDANINLNTGILSSFPCFLKASDADCSQPWERRKSDVDQYKLLLVIESHIMQKKCADMKEASRQTKISRGSATATSSNMRLKDSDTYTYIKSEV